VVPVLAQTLLTQLSAMLAHALPKQLSLTTIALLVISNSVLYAKPTMSATLVNHHLFQLPVEVQLVFALQLMSNQEAPVSALTATSRTTVNVPNAP